MRIFAGIIIFTMINICLISAGPSIECDERNAELGNFRRENTDKIKHTFIIKNTGDELLRIARVKPSCGCTVVEYDSVIAPGETGKVLSILLTKKIGSGNFKKSVSVTSNAKNTDLLRLTFAGKLLTEIDIPKRFIRAKVADGKIVGTIVLNTEKKDFKVTELIFKESTSNKPKWKNEAPIILKSKVKRSDTTDEDNYYSYTINFSKKINPPVSIYGTYILKTNHPNKLKVEVRGMFEVDKDNK